MNLKIIACALMCGLLYGDNVNLTTQDSSTNLAEFTQDLPESTTNIAQDSGESIKGSNESKQDSRDFLAPATITGNSYGAFAVGYQMLSKRQLSARDLNHGAFFALDRGWSFVDNALLFGLALDGSAGEFYSLNLGVKLGYRALSGRIIPNIAFSYGLINHKISGAQHNLHGATATLSIFTDIAQGLGLEVAYRVGLHPFPTLKKTGERAQIHSFIANFRFMDFGI